jgi:hypothetical protein
VTRFARTTIGAVALAALLSGALLDTVATPAAASPAPVPCPQLSLDKEIKKADVVFRGMVDKARPARGKGDQRIRVYTVTADRVYQSSLVTDRVRVTAEVGADCPPPDLAEGKRYIFFVTEQGSRLVSTPATAHATHRLTRQVQARLGDGVQPHSTPPAKPSFTKVAHATPPRLSRLLAPGAALLLISLLGLLVVGRLGRRTT